MRRTSLVFLFIIAAIVVLVLTGCGSDRSKSIRFEAEKLLSRADKLNATLDIQPDSNDRALQTEIKNAYYRVSDYCWTYLDSIPSDRIEYRELETIAFASVNRLSGIYFNENKFDSASAILETLLKKTKLEGRTLLATRLNLARVEQAMGNWPKASSMFHSIVDFFYPPVDNNNEIIIQVLNLPMELIQINEMIGDSAAARLEYGSAGQYYNRLIAEWPHSALSMAAHGNLARIYSDLGNWDKAIENLSLLKDSSGQIDPEAAMMIAEITGNGKKEYKQAYRLFDDLLVRIKDTTLLPVIYTRQGIMYFQGKDYDSCQATMRLIKDQYPRYYNTNPLPQNYFAISLSEQGKWNLAENELRWLIDNYPASEQAFNAYLIIADHYEKAGDKAMADSWYSKAEQFYAGISRQYSNPAILASALSYRAEVARRRQNWPQAVDYLKDLYGQYPRSTVGRNALLNAIAVYRDKLNNSAAADSLTRILRSELFLPDGGKNNTPVTDYRK